MWFLLQSREVVIFQHSIAAVVLLVSHSDPHGCHRQRNSTKPQRRIKKPKHWKMVILPRCTIINMCSHILYAMKLVEGSQFHSQNKHLSLFGNWYIYIHSFTHGFILVGLVRIVGNAFPEYFVVVFIMSQKEIPRLLPLPHGNVAFLSFSKDNNIIHVHT